MLSIKQVCCDGMSDLEGISEITFELRLEYESCLERNLQDQCPPWIPPSFVKYVVF